ncbi:hypothetical protein V1514DRAFT_326078 [Lipomyces japonicus]|uniref:uncharacterized protein n=1 Tax=Lipomyces japonicus TaxID=56871 RepID=UPI0034CEEADE
MTSLYVTFSQSDLLHQNNHYSNPAYFHHQQPYELRQAREQHNFHQHGRHNCSHCKPLGDVSTDVIDRLDQSHNNPYHHEGPFDAALPSRNKGPNAPLDAVARTNLLAMAAIAPGSLADAINNHNPIDNVAVFKSGVPAPGLPNGLEYPEEDSFIDPLHDFIDIHAQVWPGNDYATAGTNAVKVQQSAEAAKSNKRFRRLSLFSRNKN